MATTKTKTKTKAKAPTVNVVLATFDQSAGREKYRVVRDGKLGKFDPISVRDYAPCGVTPLYDAMAQFIGDLDRRKDKKSITIGLLLDESGSMAGNRQSVIDGTNEFLDGMRAVKTPDKDAAGTVMAVVFTDGLENASREATVETVGVMVKEREQNGFTFIYLGANQDAWATGAGFGLSGGATGQSVNFVASPAGTTGAFAMASSDAQHYLGDVGQYKAHRRSSSLRSLSEDGKESLDNSGKDKPS